jgi:toxin ParE1/3/4
VPIRFSEKARADFLSIHADGEERFGFDQAERYADDLERVFDLLSENPKLARLRTELNPPVRVHPHGSHVIVYEVREGAVLILRIRHAHENWTDDPL